MNLDELREQWADFDRKLQTSIRLNVQLLRESRWQKAGALWHRLSRVLVVELLINVALIVLLGVFMANEGGDWRFLAPAIALDVFAVALVIACGHQLAVLGKLDYSLPIVALQKKLETLRIERIRTNMVTLLLAPLAWTPLLIVTLRGMFGVNAYEVLDTGWLAANLLFGVAVIPLMIWVAKRHADRWQRSPLVLRLLNDLAGRDLQTAAAFLDTLSRFEQEGEHA
jgi:hypothetical protein